MLKSLFTPFSLSVILYIFVVSTSHGQNLTLNLEAQYDFSGNMNTSIGTVNGTAVGNPTLTTDRFGCPNNAYELNGSSDAISFGNNFNSVISGTSGQHAWSAWIYPQGSSGVIMAKYAVAACSNSDRQFVWRLDGGKLEFLYYTNLNLPIQLRGIKGNTTVTLNQWHHVVVSYNPGAGSPTSKVTMWVDGIQQNNIVSINNGSDGSIPSGGNAHCGTGGYLSSSGSFCNYNAVFDGKIDDIRLYSRNLSSADVNALFNLGSGPSVWSLGNAVSICAGGSITLNAPIQGTYLWSNGATTNNATFDDTYSASTIWLQITESGGCVSDDTISFTVYPDLLNLGPDLIKCKDASGITLTSNVSGGTFAWSTGQTTPSITVNPNISTTYWLEYSIGPSCVYRDSVTVTVPQDDIDLGPDLMICEGGTQTLSSNFIGASTYLWSTGANSPSIVLTSADVGSIWCSAVKDGCTYTDTLLLSLIDLSNINLLDDTIRGCVGSPLTIQAASGYSNYQWSNGQTGASTSYSDYSSHLAYVEAQYQGCTITDSIYIYWDDVNFTLDLGNDTTACLINGVQVQAPTGIVWFDGATDVSRTFYQSGSYWARFSSGCGVVYDTVHIAEGGCVNGLIYIPTAFTPNNDRLNDLFIIHSSNVTEMHTQIYNRWGGLVFESNEIQPHWDGTFEGKFASEGSYMVEVSFTDIYGQRFSKTGVLVIYR